MTTLDLRDAPLALPAQLGRSVVMTWHELPRVIGASALWMLSLAPLVAATLTGPWWLIAVSGLPVALVTTGLARFSVRIHRGERTRVREVLSVDPVLAVLIVGAATLAERAIAAGGAVQVVGYGLAAVTLVIAPLALAYGAMRDRRGFSAVRGGAILTALRPSAAITVLALALIGAFAIAATVGALALVVPCILAAFASAVVSDLLDSIDSHHQVGAR